MSNKEQDQNKIIKLIATDEAPDNEGLENDFTE